MAETVIISHQSALQFWRTHDLDPSGGIKRIRRVNLAHSTSKLQAIRPLVRNAGSTSGRIYGARTDGSLTSDLSELRIDSLPLHVMVDKPAKRNATNSLVTHLSEHPLPDWSFCRIDEHVLVASPELTLAQLSGNLPLVDLLELALEFCGAYALDSDAERGFMDRPPLTNAERVSHLAEHLAGRHGAKRLSRIVPYLVDDSASPMESIVLMLLCLPSKLGGYQIPLPEHNVAITIPDSAHSHTKRRKLICDLYWEQQRLDVECDSTRYHSSKEQLGIDSDRRIILDAMNHSHVGITWWQLEHAEEFQNVIQAIRKALGLRTHRKVSPHVDTNRNSLREYLVTPHGERSPLMLMTRNGLSKPAQ